MGFATGWTLAKTSLGVIRKDKEILLLPVLSALSNIALFAALAFGVFIPTRLFEGNESPAGYAGVALFYFVSSFIVVFFNAALVAAAKERLTGGDPTVGSALSAAWARRGPIIMWALLTATVGLLLRGLERNTRSPLGRIARGLFGAAWSVASYFVVPILVMEGGSPFTALRRSLETIRRSWRETVVAEIGTGLVFFVIGLLGALVFLAIGMTSGSGPVFGASVGLIVIWVLLVATVATAVDAVLKMALYLYATSGRLPGEFAGAPVPRTGTV
ncbi:MAG: DUF6159 family protein [Methanobacteriota archaeon]